LAWNPLVKVVKHLVLTKTSFFAKELSKFLFKSSYWNISKKSNYKLFIVNWQQGLQSQFQIWILFGKKNKRKSYTLSSYIISTIFRFEFFLIWAFTSLFSNLWSEKKSFSIYFYYFGQIYLFCIRCESIWQTLGVVWLFSYGICLNLFIQVI
jgi:hypothetical protein